MKINKHITLALISLACMCQMACSSDDDTTLNIKGVVNNKLDSYIDGGIYEISIDASSGWKTKVDDDDADWISVSDTIGNGAKTLLLSIDPNFTEAQRGSHLTISAGNETRSIEITQYQMKEGEDAGNSGIQYTKLAFTKGIGMGYDTNNTRVTYPVINSKAIEKLMKMDDAIYGDLFIADKMNSIQAEGVVIDSIENKSDELGVRAEFELGFVFFKLKGEGAYSSKEKAFDSSKVFNLSAKYPALKAKTSALSVKEFCHEAEQKKKNGENLSMEEEYELNLLSTGFRQKRDAVIKEYNNGAGHSFRNNARLNNALKLLTTYFGPTVTVGSTLGGYIALHLEVDSAVLKQKSGIDSAKISADLNAVVLRLKANVTTSVIKENSNIMNNSNYTFQIKGGDNNMMTPVIADLRKHDYDSIHTDVGKWIGSIKVGETTNGNNAELIHVTLYPIWKFFDDQDIEACVKEYVLATYSDATGVLSLWK